MDYKRWCDLSNEELGKRDIAEVSLNCAVGVEGSEGLDIPACLERLEEWTALVRRGIGNAIRNRAQFPEYDDHSEPEYRIATMFAVLYRHLGLTLNLDCQDPTKAYDGSDSRNQFIHAVLMDGHPATCCTAPVIFAAIGRRLGYPIRLVKTRQHIFCRWDDPDGERFNIEATNQGYYPNTDEYYHTWPKPIDQEALREGIFLRNLTPREELGLFLSLRGGCYLWNLRPQEAIDSLYCACQVDPRDYFFRNEWTKANMMGHAAEEAANRYGMVNCDPSFWRIPTKCMSWNVSLYQQVCELLNRIVSKRQAQQADAPASPTTDLRDLIFQEIASL